MLNSEYLKNGFNSENSLPNLDFPMVGMIKYVASIYTLTLFRDVEKEFEYAMVCISTIECMNGKFH